MVWKAAVNDLTKSFVRSMDAERAVAMSKYMKNKFEFFGIPKPERTVIYKEWTAKYKDEILNVERVDHEFITHLWDHPQREYQYMALELLNSKPYSKILQSNDIELCQSLIVSKSWWDSIDTISSNVLGTLMKEYPDLVQSHILVWAHQHENIWLKRSAILHQLKYKTHTNTALLQDIILSSNTTDEFFLNKAIGWALREYSKTNKKWVKQFLQDNKFHSLTVREASKYL